MAKVQKRTENGERLAVYPKGPYEVMDKDSGSCDPLIALLDIGIASLAGRQPAYPDTQEGLQAFQERTVQYFEHLRMVNADHEDNRVLLPDVESWATYLGITRATIWNYRTKRGEAWSGYIDRVKNLILATRKDAVSRFKMPPMAYVFDTVNNFDGYYNTSEIHVTAEQPKEERIDHDQLIAEIKARHSNAPTLEQLEEQKKDLLATLAEISDEDEVITDAKEN